MNTAIPEESRVTMQVYDDAAELARTVGKNALKMTILEQNIEKLAALRPLLEKAAGPEATVTKSEVYNLEVVDQEVSKGSALTIMAKACGAQLTDILAIGNSYNDIPMFELAGISAAVGGSDEEVLGAARYIVGTWDQDGAAEAIEKYAL
jgi:hydroxymethylpyrimidine pyrophosphatase-like HAD family hydrolase